MFLEKVVLKICSKFTGEHPCGSVISLKQLLVAASKHLNDKFHRNDLTVSKSFLFFVFPEKSESYYYFYNTFMISGKDCDEMIKVLHSESEDSRFKPHWCLAGLWDPSSLRGTR